VGWAFFPLDEQLGLLSSGVTPRAEELLVRLGTWMSFEHARELLSELLGVQVSEATARRATLGAGEAALAACEAQTERLKQEAPPAPVGAPKQAMSADGAFVPLVGGVWAEVKTLVLGEVTRNQQGEICMQHLSSFSRLGDVEHFEEATLLETHRRGLEKATEVCAVQDGAEWLPGLVDHHRADAVRILDFAHAAEHLGEGAQAAKEAGSELGDDWLSKQLHELKQHGPSQVLAQVRALAARHPEVKGLRDQLAYLQKREAQMQYPTFLAAGWPIGSGSVESANKVIVEARLKGAGMHWQRHNVNPMLVLRNAVGNRRWQETWSASWTRRRALRATQRHERSQHRLTRACWTLAAVTVRLQRMARPPAPALTATATSAPGQKPTSRLGSGYSWRQPFLRRPPSSPAVSGGLCAKK
jgi:hypothetical protein